MRTKKDFTEQTIYHKAINRFSWLLVFLFSLFGLVASIKILGIDIDTNVELNSESVLAFIIAFFSIGMSIMFYFKTEETSNRFYDNTYKFTSDTSRILGEIRGEFGEKLQSIDTGYGRIADAISPANEELIKSVGKVTKELDKASPSNRSKKIEQLNKIELQNLVKSLEKRLNSTDDKLRKIVKDSSSPLRDRALSYTRRSLVRKLGGRSIMHLSDEDIAKKIRLMIKNAELPSKYVDDLKTMGFIDEDNYLSSEFTDYIRKYGHKAKSTKND